MTDVGVATVVMSLAALAGVSFLLYRTGIGRAMAHQPTMAAVVGIDTRRVAVAAIAGAIIGGVGSLAGAVHGGLMIGLLQQLSAGWLATSWMTSITFLGMFAFIVFHPRGLFGNRMRVSEM